MPQMQAQDVALSPVARCLLTLLCAAARIDRATCPLVLPDDVDELEDAADGDRAALARLRESFGLPARTC